MGICNKIYKAFHRSDDRKPATLASDPRSTITKPPRALHLHTSKHPKSSSLRGNKDASAAKNSQGVKFAASSERVGGKEEIRRSASGINEKFSAYISHVKNKISTGSKAGGGAEGEPKMEKTEEHEKKVHLDDKANDYIKRARMKIRTTSSSLGFGKSGTFKRTEN